MHTNSVVQELQSLGWGSKVFELLDMKLAARVLQVEQCPTGYLETHLPQVTVWFWGNLLGNFALKVNIRLNGPP